jgi:lipopolysaccharide export system protein LptA
MRRLVVIGLAAALPAFSQSGPESERLRLVYADSLVGIADRGGTAKKLSGHVRLVQGGAFLDCREAIWHEAENRVALMGNVEVHDGKRTLRADRVDVDAERKIETASGNATLETGKRVLTAQSLTYLQEEEKAFAGGRVRIEDLIEKAVLLGERLMYDRKNDYCLVEEGPVLAKTDTATHQTWTLSGKTMEAWGKTQRALVTDSVALSRGDLAGEAQKAEFFSDPSRIVMTLSPVVRQASRTMKGDSITVRLRESRFTGATVSGRAEIITDDSTGSDVLKGEIITMEAENDTLRRVLVERRAESVYRVFDEKGNKQGINAVTGDQIEILFVQDRVMRVTVASKPGLCTGNYAPAGTRLTGGPRNE